MDSKVVLVDMDGVLADIHAHMVLEEYKRSGVKIDLNEIHGMLEDEAFPSFYEMIHSVGFFRSAPVVKDSVEGLRYLNDKYKVLVVSSATEFPNSLNEKHAWLNEHYPFISWKQMIFCGSKANIKGDIMIDDHSKNLLTFEGRKILFTQPHNSCIDASAYERVYAWKEIKEIL